MATKKKKSLIPYMIIAAFVLFIAFISQFVYRSIQSPVYLVRKDYYDHEIKYQNHINMSQRSTDINEQINFNYVTKDANLTINFPPEYGVLGAELWFYRPSNSELDKKIPISVQKGKELVINTDGFEPGKWIVKLNYHTEDNSYYLEKEIML